jgi:hypothetical protein
MLNSMHTTKLRNWRSVTKNQERLEATLRTVPLRETLLSRPCSRAIEDSFTNVIYLVEQ